MKEREVRLLTLEAYHGRQERRETEQEQQDWMADHMHRLWRNPLSSHELLPIALTESFDPRNEQAFTSVVLQLFDASTTVIRGSKPFIPHPDRWLVRLETVAWASTADLTKLEEPSKHRLVCLGCKRLYLVLDRLFEVRMSLVKQWNYVCLAMRSSTYEQLFEESKRLDDELDAALCLGFEVLFGRSDEEVAENSSHMESAHETAFCIFGQLDELDVALSPVVTSEDADPYKKRGSSLQCPVAKDWTEEIDGQSLRMYLRLE